MFINEKKMYMTSFFPLVFQPVTGGSSLLSSLQEQHMSKTKHCNVFSGHLKVEEKKQHSVISSVQIFHRVCVRCKEKVHGDPCQNNISLACSTTNPCDVYYRHTSKKCSVISVVRINNPGPRGGTHRRKKVCGVERIPNTCLPCLDAQVTRCKSVEKHISPYLSFESTVPAQKEGHIHMEKRKVSWRGFQTPVTPTWSGCTDNAAQ